MSILNEGSKRGFRAIYEDGTQKTNLTYLEALELFQDAHCTDNQCIIYSPGYDNPCHPFALDAQPPE
jgi:hypothetical protein